MSHNNYRSPSQYNSEFELFSSNFEKLTIHVKSRKPYLSVITGDVNPRSSSLWSNDINTAEGTKLFARTSSDGLQQLINEPTHIQKNLSSCTDVILTDQQNMSVNYGVLYIQIVTFKLFVQVLIFILPAPTI